MLDMQTYTATGGVRTGHVSSQGGRVAIVHVHGLLTRVVVVSIGGCSRESESVSS